jgi:hypothetical protein
MVWFGRPNHPNRVILVKVPDGTEPPWTLTSCPGGSVREHRLQGRLGSQPGSFGQVWYSYLTHGSECASVASIGSQPTGYSSRYKKALLFIATHERPLDTVRR